MGASSVIFRKAMLPIPTEAQLGVAQVAQLRSNFQRRNRRCSFGHRVLYPMSICCTVYVIGSIIGGLALWTYMDVLDTMICYIDKEFRLEKEVGYVP